MMIGGGEKKGHEMVAEFLEEQGWSLARLEVESGVSKEHLRGIVRGTKRLSGDVALKLAPLMGVTVEELADPVPARKRAAA